MDTFTRGRSQKSDFHLIRVGTVVVSDPAHASNRGAKRFLTTSCTDPFASESLTVQQLTAGCQERCRPFHCRPASLHHCTRTPGLKSSFRPTTTRRPARNPPKNHRNAVDSCSLCCPLERKPPGKKTKMRSEFLEEMPEEMMEYFCEQVLKSDWPNCIHVSIS